MPHNTAKLARGKMMKSQIEPNKVQDKRVVAAMELIPREEFVSDKYRGVAYIDEDLPLGEGRLLMEPMIFAKLLQLAQIQKTEKVLVIASATGYPAAVIAELAKEVVGLEDNINFISVAQENLKKLKIDNASFVKAPLLEGADRRKPFDVIFINGAVEEIPEAIISQLKNGGRIITVKVDDTKPKDPSFGVLMHKNGKVLSELKAFQAFTGKLVEFNKKRGFSF